MPYIARPSWLNGGPDQAEQKPSSSVGASLTPGATSPTPPGSAPEGGAAGQPGMQGTGFVNLNQYLQEGRGQAQDYANKNIVAPLNAQVQGLSKDANVQANKYATWDEAQKARTAAETNNEGLSPVGNEDAVAAWQKRQNEMFDDPIMRTNSSFGGWEDRQAAWNKANPKPSGTIRNPLMQNLPGVPAQPVPDPSLAGRASATKDSRDATTTMEGRGSLFARQAGQGYGHGNFDAYLSGGKPWAGVAQNYPTLWQQIKGTPGGAGATRKDMGPDVTPGVGYDQYGLVPERKPIAPRPGDPVQPTISTQPAGIPAGPRRSLRTGR